MKRAALALLVAIVLAGSAAVFAGDQNFTLINKTGLTIDKVYVSPANDNSWGEDVLGRDTLANGGRSTSSSHAKKMNACGI